MSLYHLVPWAPIEQDFDDFREEMNDIRDRLEKLAERADDATYVRDQLERIIDYLRAAENLALDVEFTVKEHLDAIPNPLEGEEEESLEEVLDKHPSLATDLLLTLACNPDPKGKPN